MVPMGTFDMPLCWPVLSVLLSLVLKKKQPFPTVLLYTRGFKLEQKTYVTDGLRLDETTKSRGSIASLSGEAFG